MNNQWPDHLPLVSIVITCFNYGDFVSEALESALLQTFENVEIIIVEGGSTDQHSRAVVEGIRDQGLSSVRFVFQTKPCLPGENRNSGISISKGRYICCLDADDVLLPTYIEVATFLAEAYGYDLVYPSIRDFQDGSAIWWVDEAGSSGIMNANQIPTVALFRRSAWAHVGGYVDYGVGNDFIPEDYDLWLRLVLHGYRTKRIRDILMLHRIHGCNLTRHSPCASPLQIQAMLRANSELVKHPPLTQGAEDPSNPWANLLMPSSLSKHPILIIGIDDSMLETTDKLYQEVVTVLSSQGWEVNVVVTGQKREKIYDGVQSLRATTARFYYLPLLFDKEQQKLDFVKFLCYRATAVLLWLPDSSGSLDVWSNVRRLTHVTTKVGLSMNMESEFGHDHGVVDGSPQLTGAALAASATDLLASLGRPTSAHSLMQNHSF